MPSDSSSQVKPHIVETADMPAAPALWNPNATIAWSFLLSPAFGAFLNMRNWYSLGEQKLASKAKSWVVATPLIIGFLSIFGAFFPEGATRVAGLSLYVGWSLTSARAHSVYVKRRFGKAYPRKRWVPAVPYGVLAIVVYIAVVLVVFLVVRWIFRLF